MNDARSKTKNSESILEKVLESLTKCDMKDFDCERREEVIEVEWWMRVDACFCGDGGLFTARTVLCTRLEVSFISSRGPSRFVFMNRIGMSSGSTTCVLYLTIHRDVH